MRRCFPVCIAIVTVFCGCKPGDKSSDPQTARTVGYSNGATVIPPQSVINSNNVYTRGSENKTAVPDQMPGSGKAANPPTPTGRTNGP
ncbi:MAG TPA: hypothetical protein VLT36_24195 [Candidatus Dormibacteraeota bacterium]|nr:hypothetical protein [Candidatus Dormibacteraeota bacterium]